MVQLRVCAFCLPYMPGNPPFRMLKNWHLAQLTAHVALASLLPLKHCFVEAGSRQFVSPKVVCVLGHRMLWCRDPSLSDSLWALTPCITEGNYG